jgi:hypothetical protein
MSEPEMTAGATVLVVLALFLFRQALKTRRREHARRMEELAVASELLAAHFQAAREVIKDGGASTFLKTYLRHYSVSVGRRYVARRIAKAVLARKSNCTPEGRAGEVYRRAKYELDALDKHRPDLVDKLDTAFSAGMLAMILRWPETRDAALRVLQGETSAPKARKTARAIGEQTAAVVTVDPQEFKDLQIAA